jgi:hypothetical protein
MPEEIKTEAKASMTKGFFANPLSWVVMCITIGLFLFNLGGSTTNRKNDVSGIAKDQTAIKEDVKGLKKTFGGYGDMQDSLIKVVNKYVEKTDKRKPAIRAREK